MTSQLTLILAHWCDDCPYGLLHNRTMVFMSMDDATSELSRLGLKPDINNPEFWADKDLFEIVKIEEHVVGT